MRSVSRPAYRHCAFKMSAVSVSARRGRRQDRQPPRGHRMCAGGRGGETIAKSPHLPAPSEAVSLPVLTFLTGALVIGRMCIGGRPARARLETKTPLIGTLGRQNMLHVGVRTATRVLVGVATHRPSALAKSQLGVGAIEVFRAPWPSVAQSFSRHRFAFLFLAGVLVSSRSQS